VQELPRQHRDMITYILQKLALHMNSALYSSNHTIWHEAAEQMPVFVERAGVNWLEASHSSAAAERKAIGMEELAPLCVNEIVRLKNLT
jgi:hypothetical protein